MDKPLLPKYIITFRAERVDPIVVEGFVSGGDGYIMVCKTTAMEPTLIVPLDQIKYLKRVP